MWPPIEVKATDLALLTYVTEKNSLSKPRHFVYAPSTQKELFLQLPAGPEALRTAHRIGLENNR